jgi:hypothetical protein
LGFGAVYFQVDADVSEKHAISIFRGCLVTSAPEDGDGMFLRNVGIDLQIHGAKTQDFYNMCTDRRLI